MPQSSLLFVSQVEGTITVEVEGTITVAQLKKEVERETGIPTEAQRLLHKGSLAGVCTELRGQA